ncbi:MAG: hypothetical protein LAO08_18500 [Acidobacteriia bacterium]|nr:hypothetical protein [Terriglobia bacterium]
MTATKQPGPRLRPLTARQKYLQRLTLWRDGEDKMKFILRHPMATQAEQLAAGRWLWLHGYRVEDY